MSEDERYEGWSNRETWAVALLINDDQGWQESVLDALREQGRSTDDEENGDVYAAGQIIRENVEGTLDGADLGIGYDMHTDPAAALVYIEKILPLVNSIGSLWRVDWTELGASFLAKLEES